MLISVVLLAVANLSSIGRWNSDKLSSQPTKRGSARSGNFVHKFPRVTPPVKAPHCRSSSPIRPSHFFSSQISAKFHPRYYAAHAQLCTFVIGGAEWVTQNFLVPTGIRWRSAWMRTEKQTVSYMQGIKLRFCTYPLSSHFDFVCSVHSWSAGVTGNCLQQFGKFLNCFTTVTWCKKISGGFAAWNELCDCDMGQSRYYLICYFGFPFVSWRSGRISRRIQIDFIVCSQEMYFKFCRSFSKKNTRNSKKIQK